MHRLLVHVNFNNVGSNAHTAPGILPSVVQAVLVQLGEALLLHTPPEDTQTLSAHKEVVRLNVPPRLIHTEAGIKVGADEGWDDGCDVG